MKLRIAVALVLVTSSPTLAQTKEAYSLKGVSLGTTLDEFKAVPIPTDAARASEEASRKEFKLPPLRRRYEVGCSPADGLVRCQWMQVDLDPPPISTQELTPFANGVGFIDFYFVDAPDGAKRLALISVRSNVVQLDNLLAAYREKYGSPKESKATAQNGLGLNVEQQIFTWSDGDNSVEMRTLCGSVTFMCITYTDQKLQASVTAAKRRAAGNISRDF